MHKIFNLISSCCLCAVPLLAFLYKTIIILWKVAKNLCGFGVAAVYCPENTVFKYSAVNMCIKESHFAQLCFRDREEEAAVTLKVLKRSQSDRDDSELELLDMTIEGKKLYF